jgi:hypothetical protein
MGKPNKKHAQIFTQLRQMPKFATTIKFVGISFLIKQLKAKIVIL